MKSTFLFALLLAMVTTVIGDRQGGAHVRIPEPGYNSTFFDAHDQLVDVTGSHAYVHPGLSDARGPCPGLNALANHAYISHDGVTNHDELLKALVDVFAIGPDLAEASIWLALPTSGSADMWTFSIGDYHARTDENETFPRNYRSHGLSGTHIAFENDVSPTRFDLYDSRGSIYRDDVNMYLEFFKQLYNKQDGISDDEVDFSLDVVANHKYERTMDSIKHNPDLFMSPANAAFGSMASHLLISNLFANHSAEHPEGRLDRATLKSFYGVSEDPWHGLIYSSGAERIPDNWYRRHSNRPYRAVDMNADILYTFKKHPELINEYFVGGNVDGKVDNWRSIDIGQLSGGNFTVESILNQPMGPLCFAIAASPEFLAPYIQHIYKDVKPIFDILDQRIMPVTKPMNCPQWNHMDDTVFRDFGGYNMTFTPKEK